MAQSANELHRSTSSGQRNPHFFAYLILFITRFYLVAPLDYLGRFIANSAQPVMLTPVSGFTTLLLFPLIRRHSFLFQNDGSRPAWVPVYNNLRLL